MRRFVTILGSTLLAFTCVAPPGVAAASDPAEPFGWASIEGGDQHNCATRTNGQLWCWGAGTDGRLGYGGTQDQSWRTQVGSASNWLQVSAGGRHTCGVRLDRTLWCWGYKGYGQLGTGSTKTRIYPKRFG
jgi:alpha-tubulin suppressor-like RCC1 family protein